MECVVYVFGEVGRSDVVKIGTCSKGGRNRFKEGYCVNPRMIEVLAMWMFPDTHTMKKMEAIAHGGLQRLPDTMSREWFLLNRCEALALLTKRFGRDPDYTIQNLPFSVVNFYDGEPYDMFRERKDIYRPNNSDRTFQCKRRLWIHEEAAPDGFAKVSHNTWSNATNWKSKTYETRGMRPVACFEFSVHDDAADWGTAIREANRQTVLVWEHLRVSYNSDVPPALRCGWISKSTIGDARAYALGRGMTEVAIDRGIVPPKGSKEWIRGNLDIAPIANG